MARVRGLVVPLTRRCGLGGVSQAGIAYEFSLTDRIVNHEENTLDHPCHETYNKDYPAMTVTGRMMMQSKLGGEGLLDQRGLLKKSEIR